jgi:DNA invertase Pin-like site-specific DNA recombinase
MEDTKNDSLSVENQRLLLDAHIAEMCVPDAEVLEFVDNGHSGTNFERPAVQELLELVRQGKVHCIVVKDLSRFGRNMIETGYYIERVFPLFRVRFIAVSDNHDSDDYEGGTGGMEVAFKFLIHEQYSRDLSLKIKTAKRAKALSGECIVKNCAFGFKKVDGRLEIDEPAAETVRLIFNMAAEGQSLAKITARLYADKRPTPSEYKGQKRKEPEKYKPFVWGKSVILNILADEQYIGTYTAGKTRKPDVFGEMSCGEKNQLLVS